MGNLQSSPSSSTTTLQEKYDVFLSFRGEDTRHGFTNNLYEALKVKHIKAFMDDELPKGERFSQLFQTIEESKISIVIFSENYGSSEWCLNEIVKIMECEKINKQTVIPVFYGVEPSAVRKDSFVKLKEKFPEEVPKWKKALIDASGIDGWKSSVTRPDTKLVNAIVDDICKKLTGENILSPSDFEGLIGLDKRIKQVKLLLCLHETNVRIIGIWGMGGIGKTTLAEAIFKQISGHQFEGACLIQNVREKLEKSGGLDHLQKDILSKVLNDEKIELNSPSIIPQIIKERLNQTKVFIVLDDVDDFIPLETLARRVDGLGQGSRIIITSRDKLVLKNCRVDDQNIYGVKEFNHDEALKLFCNYAFNQNCPTEDLKILSNFIVNYVKGNPLALKVLGSSLNQKSKKVWESAVNKLRTNIDRKIFDVLKISYDGLNVGEQEVFLDIACFLKGKDRYYVATILDDCECSLTILIDKSLITVSQHGHIDMHDLLQDLGRDIVYKKSPKKPGERSRLWRQEDVQDTLKHGDGTSEVQGVFLDMFKINDMHLSPKAFKKMYNLRLLKFYNSNKWETWSFNEVQFREGLNNASFDKLRSFIWYGYPLTALPSNFNLKNLVELDLSQSNLKRLWEDITHVPELRRLILDDCQYLTEISDLSKSPLLEKIDLHNCRNLLDFPLLAPRLNYLCELNLRGCKSLRSFPSNTHFESLQSLDLSDFINLTTFPRISGNLHRLNLSGTAIDEVPPSIENLIQLYTLHLSKCTWLKHISTNICKLKSLEELNLENCSQLESFPEILDKMEGLKFLNLSGTAIKDLPHSIEHLTNLLGLYLSRCKNLESLPCSISNLISLKSLHISGCLKLELLSENLGDVKSLEDLSIDKIAISQQSSKMMHLKSKQSCRGSRNLTFTDLLGLPMLTLSLRRLYLNDCSLKKLPEDIGRLSSLEFLEVSGNNFESLPKSMKRLDKLKSLKVDNCNMLQSLTDLPSALKHLSASGCNMLQSLSLTDPPSALKHLSASGDRLQSLIDRLQSLTDRLQPSALTSLNFNDCNLNKIPEDIGRLPSLEFLELSGNNFESLPKSMKQLSKLTSLKVDNCNMLLSLTELPSGLKHLSAIGCKKLQSIPDASEFANLVHAEFIFTNCLNLEETTVSNMLATLKEGYEEGEIGELRFCYPGSKVPGWFMYRTEGSSIVECCELKFQMPLHDGSNGRRFVGFVVCAVIAFEEYCIEDDLCVGYKYTRSSPSNIKVAFDAGYTRVAPRNRTLIDSDHIAFRFCKASVARNKFPNCSFEFWLSDEKSPNCRIKSFGVCPVYVKHNITLLDSDQDFDLASYCPFEFTNC